MYTWKYFNSLTTDIFSKYVIENEIFLNEMKLSSNIVQPFIMIDYIEIIEIEISI